MMPRAESVDAYLSTQPAKARAVLEKIRALVRKVVPDGEETVSYGIPAVKRDGKALVYFAGFKEHVGLFPPVRDAALLRELKPYAGPKGNLKFPLDQTMPYALIRKVIEAHANRVAASKPARKALKKVVAKPGEGKPAKMAPRTSSTKKSR